MPKVQSVGKYADPVALVGEVKLEEGANIQIDRDDAHNSLIITSTLAPYPQVASDFSITHSILQSAGVDNPDLTFA